MRPTTPIPQADVLRAFQGAPFTRHLLFAAYPEVPEKVVYSRMATAVNKGYVDYGVSMRTGWLTDKGYFRLRQLMAEDGRIPHQFPTPPEGVYSLEEPELAGWVDAVVQKAGV